ncbi:PRD domain-containing protein [Clostridium tyrobutyricum]|uniref:PRD domain-containing protein n=1 Tax=Clostridium tyrobutyricum TaxID=1519 RepID=UPI0011C8D103|nr:PRD domain-containing protein [Clostridium tyrobutyricum]MBV4448384.1 PRD domain-containing protein [Clostridium tyrobutyricum]MCH4200746.1 PRD domain-containing protein [Clostridium tyrobutyricum]MCH4237364.1 PRD domain-containing protein [Clostridium tyrobutyricum]MCH4257743.1 PRD domain-containing protein [Clostridium tyrobutyricum]MCI1237987.1 PRD domain-containing protein [Clostridium tyrobutyricum]
MEKYTVQKVLNNNVVLAQKNHENLILVGKGIGFNSRKGQTVPKDRIENIFVKESSISNNFDTVLRNVDQRIIGISEEIISLCERKLDIKLNEVMHISLPDHINFALRRVKEGIKIENPFLQELVVLYPKEYKLAEKSLDMINKNFDIKLPEDEIGFICMHINAAVNKEKVGDVMNHTRKITQIMDTISKLLKKKFDKNSLEYIRTVTHINFVLNRVINKKTVKNYLLDNIKKELYNEYDLAIKITIKIENLFSVKVPEDEIGYIALHLKRLEEI